MSEFSTRDGGAGQMIANVSEHSLWCVDFKTIWPLHKLNSFVRTYTAKVITCNQQHT